MMLADGVQRKIYPGYADFYGETVDSNSHISMAGHYQKRFHVTKFQ